MILNKFYKYLSLAFFLLSSLTTNAHPKHIYFNEMIERSSLIAVAECISESENPKFSVTIRLHDILKGTPANDTMTVPKVSYAPYLKVNNQRFIVILNEYGAFEWGGFSDDVYNDIVHLTGFYDFNMYSVSPSGITMAQLKEYLKTGQYKGNIQAELNKGTFETFLWDKPPIFFNLHYTYDGKMHCFLDESNIPENDFDAPRAGFWGSGLSIEYSENSYRPLEFIANRISCDESGFNFTCDMIVNEPDDLTAEEFEKYMVTPSMGYIYYELDIEHDGKHYSYFDGDERDNTGGYIVNYKGKNIDYNSFNPSTEEEEGSIELGKFKNPELIVVFHKFPVNEEYKELSFFQRLARQPISGELIEVRGGRHVNMGKCKITLKKKHFRKLK